MKTGDNLALYVASYDDEQQANDDYLGLKGAEVIDDYRVWPQRSSPAIPTARSTSRNMAPATLPQAPASARSAASSSACSPLASCSPWRSVPGWVQRSVRS